MATPTEAAEIASALDRSRDPAWQVRCAAAEDLARFSGDERAERRLTELLHDPDNISVIEAVASALATTGGTRGLTLVAAVFDSLDEQAAAYASVAVSDALGDSVFVRLLEVITGASDARIADGARRLGTQIGMESSPQWEQALAASR